MLHPKTHFEVGPICGIISKLIIKTMFVVHIISEKRKFVFD